MENTKKKKNSFMASLPVELHKPVKVAAALEGVGLSEWIADAIRLKLEDSEDGK